MEGFLHQPPYFSYFFLLHFSIVVKRFDFFLSLLLFILFLGL